MIYNTLLQPVNRPSQGERTGGRWDYVKEAVTNAVAEQLVTEIAAEAIREEGAGVTGKTKRAKHRVPSVGRPAMQSQEHRQGNAKENDRSQRGHKKKTTRKSTEESKRGLTREPE